VTERSLVVPNPAGLAATVPVLFRRSALVGAARSGRPAAALALAGRSWLRVLNRDVDAAGVISAAE
jgi:hypothetical protein